MKSHGIFYRSRDSSFIPHTRFLMLFECFFVTIQAIMRFFIVK